MTVAELMERLARLDPELPVIMEQSDEPLGDYEVLDVEVVPGQPDRLYHRTAPTYGGKTWDYPQVWNTYDGGDISVVLLGSDKPYQPTIDGEIEAKALTQGSDTP